MDSSRNHIELWLRLTDPAKAREYIAAYDWNLPPHIRPNKLYMDSGRTIYFDKMTDEEAVLAATTILRDVEVPMIMRDKQFELWEH